MESQEQYKYFAFISYNSKDTCWGKSVQRKLEGYRMPSTLCSEHGWKRKPIRPVFFAPTDIQPGGLSEELQERLKASRNLIVICSPNSAKSEWVGKEIKYFHSLGRTDNIHFFIVDGIPHSGNEDTECFNPITDTLGLPEILGANVHEKVSPWPWVNRERAYVQLVTKLLCVEFDSIWRRHKRLMREKCAAWLVGVIAVIAALIGVKIANQPIDVRIHLNEVSVHNDNLTPIHDIEVSMELDGRWVSDTIYSLDDSAIFPEIAPAHRGQLTHIQTQNACCEGIDTFIVLHENISLPLRRDTNYFGSINVLIISDGIPLCSKNVNVNGSIYSTDKNGVLKCFIPLNKQLESYRVTFNNKRGQLNMPCKGTDCLMLK